MIQACPVCGSADLLEVFARERVPVAQNIVFDSLAEAAAIARRDVRLVHCATCDFVCNGAFDPDAVAYDERYDNAQLDSPTYTAYVDGLVAYMLDDAGLRDARVIEVGCGKGEFLHRLVTAPGSAVRGRGFDPSYTGPGTGADGRWIVEQRYFAPGIEHFETDAILCRHVIEHMPDPRTFLRSIVEAAAGSPAARYFFETPSVEWILDERAFWDVFYEHCNYWSEISLRRVYEEAGLHVDGLRRIWRDQFLWIEGIRAEPGSVPLASAAGSDLRARLLAFAREESERRARMLREVAELPGSVALWGAAAKGVTLANLLDPGRASIACLIDINPQKQGKFIAGSGHPIVSPARAVELGVERIYVMNPNYLRECETMLRGLGSDAELRNV